VTQAAVRVSDLHKTYRKSTALAGLSFEIAAGRITGFLGPNGAGKTTTFRALLGLTRPGSGDIEVLGMPIPGRLREVTKKVGAIVEEPGLIKAHSGRVNLLIAADTLGFGHERVGAMIDFVGLTHDAGRKVGEYSKGMRQRLALAAAMLGEPELLLLDEPLDGLDPAGQHAFRERLRALADEGRTVVISSHDLKDIEALADDVVVVDQGRLVTQEPLAELLEHGMTRVAVADVEGAAAALESGGLKSRSDDRGLLVEADDASEIVRILAEAHIFPSEVRPERTSLETVFLGITGDRGR